MLVTIALCLPSLADAGSKYDYPFCVGDDKAGKCSEVNGHKSVCKGVFWQAVLC